MIRQRTGREERQKKAEHIGREDDGDQGWRQAEVLLVQVIQRCRRGAARGEGHRRDHGDDDHRRRVRQGGSRLLAKASGAGVIAQSINSAALTERDV
jgi:hypothetical protein